MGITLGTNIMKKLLPIIFISSLFASEIDAEIIENLEMFESFDYLEAEDEVIEDIEYYDIIEHFSDEKMNEGPKNER